MENFDPIAESTQISRPCSCRDDGADLAEKSFCYAEGPEYDKLTCDTPIEITENTWYETKPPRLYTRDFFPLITARQIFITRILLEGKHAVIEDEDDTGKTKEKIKIGINKKKSAVRFLSQVESGQEHNMDKLFKSGLFFGD